MSNQSDKNRPKDNEAAPDIDKLVGNGKEKILAIGQQRVHVHAITTKINEDIAFLQDRIKRMKQMKSPSQTVLNTYEAMLSSRLSVLKWLEEHDMITGEEEERQQQVS